MKTLAILASVALLSFETAAQQIIDITSGDVVDSVVSTAPTRVIENLDNGVRVTYTFDYARLDSVSSDSGNGAFIVSFNGFGLCEIPGQPALPSKLDAIEVPSAEDVVLTVETIDYSDYFFEIAAAVAPVFESAAASVATSVTPISVSDGFFPSRQVEIVGSQSYNEKEICYLTISPVAYDHATKSVRIANKIVYTVSFGEAYVSANKGPRNARSAGNDAVIDDPVYNNIVLNAQSSTSPEFGEVVQDYLILTTAECKSAVNKFADWKRALGFRTHVSVLPTGDDVRSDAIVKDSIEVYAKKYGRKLKYLLIVGDTTAIQSYKRVRAHSSEKPHLSDYYYGCIFNHNFVLVPDLHRGRIPAKTNQEAQNAFEKIIAYERCAGNTSNFFKNGLHCASFENTKDLPRNDTRRFVCTSEEVLESARSIGLSPTRVYSAVVPGTPIFYSGNPYYETHTAQMPDEITFDFNWNGSTSDIKSFLENKDGVSYVLYRGHGIPWGWQRPEYKYDDIMKENYGLISSPTFPQLNKMFPVVFSITCLTGKFDDPNCFASKSILGNRRGSSCIIASYEESFSGFNDAFTLGMFDAFYPEPIHSTYITHRDSVRGYRPVYRIGEIMDQGLYRMAQKKYVPPKEDATVINHTIYTYEVFHCFGDPSMLIWCQEPTKFENANIELDANTLVCNVTTGGEPAYISFYDKNINKVQCFYGTEASFEFSQIHKNVDNGIIYGGTSPEMEYVVISAPNKIPIVKSSWGSNKDEQISVVTKIENLSVLDHVIRVTYCCDVNDDVKFIITSVSTGKSRVVEQPKGETEAVIDLSNEAPGSYVVTLVVNGNNEDSSTILIN
ncbi:MAG: hypothetical protein K2H33_05195 [Muribaculaceae bacterium]|nr:hypothetical protein [Muribaculaceae bacterium]